MYIVFTAAGLFLALSLQGLITGDRIHGTVNLVLFGWFLIVGVLAIRKSE